MPRLLVAKLFNELLLDEHGQAESVFRLMIDSIVGLAILLIIISMLGYFNDQTARQSQQELTQRIQSAASSPNGNTFYSSELSFTKGFSIDAIDVQNLTGYGAQCFHFVSNYGGVVIDPAGQRVEFSQALQTQVFTRCIAQATCDPVDHSPQAQCCVCCLISFGKDIRTADCP